MEDEKKIHAITLRSRKYRGSRELFERELLQRWANRYFVYRSLLCRLLLYLCMRGCRTMTTWRNLLCGATKRRPDIDVVYYGVSRSRTADLINHRACLRKNSNFGIPLSKRKRWGVELNRLSTSNLLLESCTCFPIVMTLQFWNTRSSWRKHANIPCCIFESVISNSRDKFPMKINHEI